MCIRDRGEGEGEGEGEGLALGAAAARVPRAFGQMLTSLTLTLTLTLTHTHTRQGIEMDHGCQMLGMVPHRFGNDAEVIEAFNGFTSACQTSMERALTAPLPGQPGQQEADLASKVKQVEIS